MKNSGIKIQMLWIKVKILGAMSRLCRLLKKTIVYQSEAGLKEINPIYIKRKYTGKQCVLSPNELYLGIDFLKDKYTLIDVPIVDSPHFRLMKVLYAGGDARQTDYVTRMLNGSLDERYENIAYYLNASYFGDCFQRKMEQIVKDTNDEVIIYRLHERYYIHDGKHRAALCALLGKSVKCTVVEISEVVSDFNERKIRNTFKNQQYRKHTAMFSSIRKEPT